jgi:hypothetical protein
VLTPSFSKEQDTTVKLADTSEVSTENTPPPVSEDKEKLGSKLPEEEKELTPERDIKFYHPNKILPVQFLIFHPLSP